MSAYSLPGPAPPYQRMDLVGAVIDTSTYLIPSSEEADGDLSDGNYRNTLLAEGSQIGQVKLFL